MQLSLILRVQSGYSLAGGDIACDALVSPIGVAFGFAGGGAVTSGIVCGAGAGIMPSPGGMVAASGGISGMGVVVCA